MGEGEQLGCWQRLKALANKTIGFSLTKWWPLVAGYVSIRGEAMMV